mmetsp:Transcript_51422/g.76287  ORF Transcript_51422/g.76287 Transcript_51422/m.76287 type:complete len:555 (+) Transcript_51422:156-1820(+)
MTSIMSPYGSEPDDLGSPPRLIKCDSATFRGDASGLTADSMWAFTTRRSPYAFLSARSPRVDDHIDEIDDTPHDSSEGSGDVSTSTPDETEDLSPPESSNSDPTEPDAAATRPRGNARRSRGRSGGGQTRGKRGGGAGRSRSAGRRATAAPELPASEPQVEARGPYPPAQSRQTRATDPFTRLLDMETTQSSLSLDALIGRSATSNRQHLRNWKFAERSPSGLMRSGTLSPNPSESSLGFLSTNSPPTNEHIPSLRSVGATAASPPKTRPAGLNFAALNDGSKASSSLSPFAQFTPLDHNVFSPPSATSSIQQEFSLSPQPITRKHVSSFSSFSDEMPTAFGNQPRATSLPMSMASALPARSKRTRSSSASSHDAGHKSNTRKKVARGAGSARGRSRTRSRSRSNSGSGRQVGGGTFGGFGVGRVPLPVLTEEQLERLASMKVKKGKWSADEDRKLAALVDKYGDHEAWKHICLELGGRNTKQCRERWNNHLNPRLRHGDWSAEEDVIIETMRNDGAGWAEIAKKLTGRTDNKVKIRYHSIIRRKARESQQKNK